MISRNDKKNTPLLLELTDFLQRVTLDQRIRTICYGVISPAQENKGRSDTWIFFSVSVSARV